MAFFQATCFSHALKMRVSFNVVLPEGKKDGYKTLYLLHGLSDNRNAWCSNTSIERYAAEYGIAVVMPEVARSWYSNTPYGANYFDFVAKELPEICRSFFKGMSEKREDNLVAGLSMGGYGALKVALTYPEAFGCCASLSGSLDITRKDRPYSVDEWRGNFGFDLADALELEGGENDIFELTKAVEKSGKPFPKTFIWCGTEDSLIAVNREYRQLLEQTGADFCYRESQGNHSWKWWDLHIQSALEFLLKQ